VIDEEALADAIEAGRLAGAGLDVHEFEPRINARLAMMPRVVLLPHLGSATESTRREMALMAARNVVAALAGERPPQALNAPAAAGRRD
jgi:lactate dehydrogenase-like 2-hydroxyacid dehydrogenase